VTIAICWCCLGACCHRLAKRQQARRQRQGDGDSGGPDLQGIQPVTYGLTQDPRVQYQMVCPQMQLALVPQYQMQGVPGQPPVVYGLYPGH
jgi:hypothetical protein